MCYQAHETIYVFSGWRAATAMGLGQGIRERWVAVGASQLEQRGERVPASFGMCGYTPEKGPQIEGTYRKKHVEEIMCPRLRATCASSPFWGWPQMHRLHAALAI